MNSLQTKFVLIEIFKCIRTKMKLGRMSEMIIELKWDVVFKLCHRSNNPLNQLLFVPNLFLPEFVESYAFMNLLLELYLNLNV